MIRSPRRSVRRLVALRAGGVLLMLGVIVGSSVWTPPAAQAAGPGLGLVPPTLIGPAPYAASPSNPVFTWNAVPGAIKYTVIVRSIPDKVIWSCGGETTALSLVCDELRAGPYVWTVQAVGPNNELGPFATERQFVKQPRLTSAPTLTSPASGTTFTFPDGMGLLRWSPLPNAARYQLDVSTDPTFPGPDPEPTYGSLETEASIVPFDDLDTTMYWRVRGVTESRVAAGPWSTVRSFRVTWPVVPQLVSPPDGASLSDLTLAWSPIAGATRYEIETAALTDPTFQHPTATSDSATPFVHWGFTPSPPSFLWRVRARNRGWSRTAWSAARSVTVDAGSPAAPAAPPEDLPAVDLVGPADGAVNVSPKVTPLDWKLVPGALGYDVQILPSSQDWFDPGPSQANGMVPPLVPTLDAGTTYKWRVRANATDSVSDLGPWSEIRTFTTPAVGVVPLVSPPDGASRDNEHLLFTWTAVASAPIYDVDLSRTPDFATPLTMRTYVDPRIAFQGPLAPGTWYWRVRAGHNQTTAISPVWTVTIVDDTPPVGRSGLPWRMSTSADEILIGPDADDAITDVAATAASPDGVSWTEFAFPGSFQWSLVTPTYGGTAAGPRALWLRWRDTAGNWSTPTMAGTIWYGMDLPPDTDLPISSGPRMTIVAAGTIPTTGTIPVHVAWTATDATSLVTSSELTRSVGSSGWTMVAPDLPTPVLDMWLAHGTALQLHARARDEASNVGPYATGPTYRISRFSENNSAITYTGRWATVKGAGYWRGAARKSGTAGSTATIRFTGRSIAFVSRRGPTRGTANVYVDGTKVATIDLYSPTSQDRQIAWSMDWATSTARRVTIRINGTPGRARVDIDGFAVIR